MGPGRPRADLGRFRARPGDAHNGTFPARPNAIPSSTSGPANGATKKKKKKKKNKKKTTTKKKKKKKNKTKTTMAIIVTMPVASSIVMIKETTPTTLAIAITKATATTMATETITQTTTTIRTSRDNDPPDLGIPNGAAAAGTRRFPKQTSGHLDRRRRRVLKRPLDTSIPNDDDS